MSTKDKRMELVNGLLEQAKSSKNRKALKKALVAKQLLEMRSQLEKKATAGS